MIGLADLVRIVKMHGSGFRSVRALSCDIMEVRLVAGFSVNVPDGGELVGIIPYDKGLIHIGTREKNDLHLTAHILPNGVFEMHSGRWRGGIRPAAGVDMSAGARVGRPGTFALVEFDASNDEDEDKDEDIQQLLYCYYGGQWITLAHEATSADFDGYDPEWWMNALRSKECLHSFVQWTTTGFDERTEICERCDYCDEERSRPATESERVNSEEFFGRNRDIHSLSQRFEEAVGKKPGDGMAVEVGGYEVMERAERFAEENPQDVYFVGVDDAAFACSALVLVNRRNEKTFMGTSVFYIPQCMGNGAEFFLYPNHLRCLSDALRMIDNQQRAYKPMDVAD